MSVNYDKYYQTEDLFGPPYPELTDFFEQYPEKGKVLDVGCGQGRDAIALARMGYEVVGIDHSKVGIDQMNVIAKQEGLQLIGKVEDIYNYHAYQPYDFILLDSMFHFAKKDRKREETLLKRVVSNMKSGAILVLCIQDTGKKVDILHHILKSQGELNQLADQHFTYTFEDKESGHRSISDYRMVAVEK